MNAAVAPHVADDIAYHLEAIGKHFKNPKLTVIVRAPQLKDGDFIMSDDALDDAMAAILRLKARRL